MRQSVLISLALMSLSSSIAGQDPTKPPTPPIPTIPGQPPQQPVTRPAIRPPVADTGIFAPLPWPAGTESHRASGAVGRGYWQQRADYSIKATLDTAAKTLQATVRLRYTNHSPDTLRYVWMQMDQNLFRPGSTGSLLNAANSRFGGADFQGGYTIESINQVIDVPAGGIKAGRPGKPARAITGINPNRPLKTRVDETMMYVDLADPLAPGATATIDYTYRFNIPEHGADRMGREGNLYEMAQWYPRVAVYDELHGWNTAPYLGQGEFYLEYGDISYEVTVPAGYIVAGSGVIENPTEVLTPAQRSRLVVAIKSDTTIHIITGEELTSGAARPKHDGTLTWKFKAQNVRDVAWAAAPNYLWDASGWSGSYAFAYYRPAATAHWKEAAKMSRFSIQEYGTRWFPYPYPQISAIEGLVSGMEYPMVAMETNGESLEELYNVVTHEIGHMWYPMIVGSDERRYAWMDEGFNTFINTFSEAAYWKRDDANVRRQEIRQVVTVDQTATAQPIMTPANRYRTQINLGLLAYVKPSIMLLTLRNKVLGAETFDAALREYTRRWAFKHPQPEDFYHTMEDVSGRDLSWFWRGFFYTSSTLDQAVENVTQEKTPAGRYAVRVILRNNGAAVMPVELELTFEDGATQMVKLPVEIWFAGDRYVYRVTTDKPIIRARVNADGLMPDLIPSNDSWGQPPKQTP